MAGLLSLLEAEQIGILTYHLFSMMNPSDDGTFSPAKFVGSILGQSLKVWSAHLNSAMSPCHQSLVLYFHVSMLKAQ
jgi:hypothetical protein